MPAKKSVKEATAVETEPAVEKKPAKKAAPKKTAAKKEPAEKKAPAKKAAAKKPAVKKTAKKEEPKPEVEKKSFQTYKDVINWKKWEAHNMNWLYIEVNAGDLMTELEAGVNNIDTCCNAILDCMLEGDTFIVQTDKPDTKLTVRYYCDNLAEDRRKWSDVNK
ncbi:MAG: hypothetical protein ACI4WR_04465 [Bulleidia sp.]